MGTMTVDHAPPVEAPTPGELAIAAGQAKHGTAAITVTAFLASSGTIRSYVSRLVCQVAD